MNMDAYSKLKAIEAALGRLSPHERDCRLCPRECGVDRAGGDLGRCRTGTGAVLARGLLHFGEEPPLSGVEDVRREGADNRAGRCGSGTLFFAGCGLHCLFCQNHQLSWGNQGRRVTDEELAGAMEELQARGALNINLVTPGHVLPAILRALRLAVGRGLVLPLVYNSSGYEKTEVLEALEGVVDIYLPDIKYRSPETAERYSSAPDYFSHASRAVREMHRQQPRLELDRDGIARRGLIVRHLVLPGQAADSSAILEWVAAELSPSVRLSLMGQYRPVFRAPAEINRTLSAEEYRLVLDRAEVLGFEEIYAQADILRPEEHFIPDFDLRDPFGWDDCPADK